MAYEWSIQGKVTEVVGTIIEATIPNAALAKIAYIENRDTNNKMMAEVVGFRGNKTLLLPFQNMTGIHPGARVTLKDAQNKIKVGPELIGKVIDPFMNDLSSNYPINFSNPIMVNIDKDPPNPMSRSRICRPLSLGVRAIDGLLTVGEGQRIGLMAGSGVGKSVLMGMIAQNSQADINIIGLIGERGREVKEFVERDLKNIGLAKSIVVVVTSDQSPLLKIRAAKVVTTLAEHFAGIGKKVLLIMDSITRVAQAQREIGLAVGEPPTSKGYTPSVFSMLPKILERCGPQKEGFGSISGIYTVLVDGDDFNDPLPDTVRSILDGHINLSRNLANQNHFPAIEVMTSISRVMSDVVNPEHLEIAGRIKKLLSIYEENIDYIQIGSYQEGTNPNLDFALKNINSIKAFLRQKIGESDSMQDTILQMKKLFEQLE